MIKNHLKIIPLILFTVLLNTAPLLAQKSTGSVKGKVRAVNGKKLSGVNITVRKDGKNLKSSVTNKRGEFRIRGLAPGTYNLVFEKPGFSSGVLYNVLVKKRKINNLKDRLIMTVDQGTLVIVNGSVFNQFGKSVYGAKIRIEEIRSGRSARRYGTLYSSESGQFTYRFPEGKRKLRITASALGVSESKEIVVEEPAIYRLALTLNLPLKKK